MDRLEGGGWEAFVALMNRNCAEPELKPMTLKQGDSTPDELTLNTDDADKAAGVNVLISP